MLYEAFYLAITPLLVLAPVVPELPLIVSALPLIMPKLLFVVLNDLGVLAKLFSILRKSRLACPGLFLFQKLFAVLTSLLHILLHIPVIVADLFAVPEKLLSIARDVIRGCACRGRSRPEESQHQKSRDDH